LRKIKIQYNYFFLYVTYINLLLVLNSVLAY